VQKTIILPVVFKGAKFGLSYYGKIMFKNRALRKIFGTKREEVVGGWRKLHNEELHNLYTS
jgi:hypothetical protein